MNLAAAPLLALALAAHAPADGPRLLVLNKADATLSILDPTGARPAVTVPTGTGPHEIAVAPDGRTAFVANYGDQQPGNSLSRIDLAAGAETRRVDLGPLMRPHGLAVVEGKLYFTAEVNRVVARYDPESDRVDRVVGLGQDATHMIAATRDGRLLVTANIGSDTVTVVDRKTGRIEHIPVGREPEGIDVAPDGATAWVGHRIDGLVTVVDLAARRVAYTLDVGDVAIRVKLTPDGARALVTEPAAGTLVVVDAATREVVKRLPLGEAPVGLVITPDGATAYVALAGEDRVVAVDLTTLEVNASFPTGRQPDGIAWVPAPAPDAP